MKNAKTHQLPARGAGIVRSMASFKMKGTARDQKERTPLSAQEKKYKQELAEEQAKLEKVMSSSTYLAECMKKNFGLLQENKPRELTEEEKSRKKALKEVHLFTAQLDKMLVPTSPTVLTAA